MNSVRLSIHRAVRKNKERKKGSSTYSTMLTRYLCVNDVLMTYSCFHVYISALAGRKVNDVTNDAKKVQDQLDHVIDIREYDVPYHVRVSIDLRIHVGLWYDVTYRGGAIPPLINRRDDLLERPVSFC